MSGKSDSDDDDSGRPFLGVINKMVPFPPFFVLSLLCTGGCVPERETPLEKRPGAILDRAAVSPVLASGRRFDQADGSMWKSDCRTCAVAVRRKKPRAQRGLGCGDEGRRGGAAVNGSRKPISYAAVWKGDKRRAGGCLFSLELHRSHIGRGRRNRNDVRWPTMNGS